MIVKTTCPICHKVTELEVPEEGYKAFQNGEIIQNALPDLTPDQREMLISGICPKCWDAMFPEED